MKADQETTTTKRTKSLSLSPSLSVKITRSSHKSLEERVNIVQKHLTPCEHYFYLLSLSLNDQIRFTGRAECYFSPPIAHSTTTTINLFNLLRSISIEFKSLLSLSKCNVKCKHNSMASYTLKLHNTNMRHTWRHT